MGVSKRITLAVLLLALSILVMITDAASFFTPQQEGSEYCKDKHGTDHQLGDIWYYQGVCELHKCATVKDHRHMLTTTCKELYNPNGCKIVQGTGNYPNCCPRVAC